MHLPLSRARSSRSPVVALVLLAAVCCAPAARTQSLEFAVKATFLHKFTGFVEWPESAFEASHSPFVLCVAGADPVSKLIDQAAAGQAYGTHPIEVRHVAQPSSVGAACHLLYAGGLPPDTVDAYLQAARGKPILTVTDGASRRAQGVINFVLRDNRVRFEIDLEQASAQRLVVSSKLASLALPPRSAP